MTAARLVKVRRLRNTKQWCVWVRGKPHTCSYSRRIAYLVARQIVSHTRMGRR